MPPIQKTDEDQAVLLGRVDERTLATQETVEKILDRLDSLDEHYVSRAEFRPVRSVVYGLVGLVSAAVVGLIADLLRGR